jgi:hypothetical protein
MGSWVWRFGSRFGIEDEEGYYWHWTYDARLYGPGDTLLKQRSDWAYKPSFSTELTIDLTDPEPGIYRYTIDWWIEDYYLFQRQGQTTLVPREPADLARAGEYPDSFVYTGPGDYLLTRVWQVWDNYGLRWNYDNMPISEWFNIQTNGCNIQIATSDATTNAYGRFQDKYGNYDGQHPIQYCQVNPNCVTGSRQTIQVAGVDFSHDVTWRCSSVNVARQ